MTELSPREIQVLRGAAYGESGQETATRLGITYETLKSHRRHLMGKLHARSITNAVAVAYEEGLLGREAA